MFSRETPEQKEIRRVCTIMGETVERWNAVDCEEYEDEEIPFYYFLTNQGYRYALFFQGTTRIVDGDANALIRVENSPADFKPWERD